MKDIRLICLLTLLVIDWNGFCQASGVVVLTRNGALITKDSINRGRAQLFVGMSIDSFKVWSPDPTEVATPVGVLLANNRAVFLNWVSNCPGLDSGSYRIKNGNSCWAQSTSPYLQAGNGLTRVGDTFMVTPRIMTSVTRSITTSTGATGFQVSATRDALVSYSATIVTTSTLGGGAIGTVVLEIAPTNSATASDWVEVGRMANGNVVGLAIAITNTNTQAGQLSCFVPAGYYVKLRSINTLGTPVYTYNSGREVLQ